jgi:class 3 adenylate cyclase
MPIFMDRHELEGVTAAQIAKLHAMDLQVQDKLGVRILTYWFDEARGTGFCLIDAPDEETAISVHAASHGNVAADIIEIQLSAVEAFLGRIADPAGQAQPAEANVDSAFRAVMFTDIVESTAMTARLGDTQSVEMVRSHDSIVRRALRDAAGHEVKHTGDGIMASFDDVVASVECSCAIQRAFEAFNRDSREELHVRIGVHCGEPVEDSHDLFGATVQMAARLCERGDADAVLVSQGVCDELPRRFAVKDLGESNLKGFAEPVPVFEVDWRAPGAPERA